MLRKGQTDAIDKPSASVYVSPFSSHILIDVSSSHLIRLTGWLDRLNLLSQFVENGNRWCCPLCGQNNEVPNDYFCPLFADVSVANIFSAVCVSRHSSTRSHSQRHTHRHTQPHSFCPSVFKSFENSSLSVPVRARTEYDKHVCVCVWLECVRLCTRLCSLNCVQGQRQDQDSRPELKSGVVEFVASPDYMNRPPMAPYYLLVLDVTMGSVQSGFLRSVCETLKEVVSEKRLPGLDRAHFGLITFDSNVHFYNINSKQTTPHVSAHTCTNTY